MQVITKERMARFHACFTAEAFTDVYSGSPFYITTANFAMIHASLLKHQKIGEARNPPAVTFHIKVERYSYYPTTQRK